MASMTAPQKRRRTGLPISTPRSALPPFLTALWDMVESEENNNVISWTRNGTAFAVHDPESFEMVLPTYFKHNRFTSFIRQLNMYQFSKVSAETGNWEWRHDGFRRDAPELMHTIQRRAPSSSASVLANSTQQHQAIAIACAPVSAPCNGKESLLVQPMVVPSNPDHHTKSLEQRVNELEKNRLALLSELRYEKIAQQKMQKQIETLEGQIQAIMNYLFKNKSFTPPNFSINQLLLEDRKASPSSLNDVPTPGTEDIGSGHATPQFTESFAPSDSLHPTVTFTEPASPHSIPDVASNGLSSVDALMLDLDLNLEDLPRLPDLPESPMLLDNHDDQRYSECSGKLSENINPIITTTSCPAEAAKRDLLRSVVVPEEDNRVLSNAQSLMQKLLEEMASAYHRKGLDTLLPSSYDGLGCWFVRNPPKTRLPEDKVNPDSEPWAVLFYGLKSGS